MKAVSGMMLTLLFVGMHAAFSVQSIKASGTVYITSDYTLTQNIYEPIVVLADSLVIDGNGYTLQGLGSGTGIDLSGRSNVTIKNTEIKAFQYGIKLHESSNCSVFENTVTENTVFGIYLEHSSNNTFSANKMTNNGWGIYLTHSSNYNNIYGNNITNNDDGITLSFSSNNILTGNNITKNHHIYLDVSSNNILTGNTITNNYYGFSLFDSSNNHIAGNNITDNHCGIALMVSSNNSITGNTITNNSDGIRTGGSSENMFYHNNFIDNTRQVYDYSRDYSMPPSMNTWDQGYPSGGNYWNNHTGVDVKSGPNQDQPSSDGIDDTEYFIDENNRDNYSLMGIFHSFNTSLRYDVNVISNSTLKHFQYFEYNNTIEITISNVTANQTHGFCRLKIHHDLMSPAYNVIINDTVVPYTIVFENENLSIIYFTYEHSTLQITVTPEFPTWTTMLLILIVLTVAIAVYKRRLNKTPTH